MANAKVCVASDHNGNAARAYILRLLADLGVPADDLGPTEAEGKVDYIDFAEKVCRGILSRAYERGILICGTGTGMCIVANRFPGIRAGLATDRATAYLSREHNDSNVLVLGQWRTPLGDMDEIVQAWLETEFGQGRHIQRLEKLANLKP